MDTREGTPDFSEIAGRVESPYRWDDLKLPAKKLGALREICAYVRQRAMLGERSGFSRPGSAVRGITVLLLGPSGTGKTMSASVIARELVLELYRVNLAHVVSKYVGETEKNLARADESARNEWMRQQGLSFTGAESVWEFASVLSPVLSTILFDFL
jgi:SpoVK/Ycf46/Vps4 family AAA+-type ATPase